MRKHSTVSQPMVWIEGLVFTVVTFSTSPLSDDANICWKLLSLPYGVYRFTVNFYKFLLVTRVKNVECMMPLARTSKWG